MSKKIVVIAVAATLLIAAGVWARIVLSRGDDDLPADARVARATRRDMVAAVKATGIIKPMIGAEVRVGSRVSGVVKRLYVRVGDTVGKGELLAELDARDLEAKRSETVAALNVAEANLLYAEADLRRKNELRAERVISSNEMDLAQKAWAVAKERRAQARANLAYATTQLRYARIFAPISGVVGSVTTQEGETVAASFSAPTFVTLIDLGRLEVRAYVDETDIGRVRVGQKALFTVDTYPDTEFEGRVTAIYPQAEIRDNVVDYVTVIRFDPPRDHLVRPEMTTMVRIVIATREHVLTVPRRAVQRDDGRSFVFRVRGNATEVQPVTTGGRDDDWVEIVNGLHDGDEVLVGTPKESEGGLQ